MLDYSNFCFSPYWVESYNGTFTNFKHMGLWEYCFDHYRYPNNQLDQLFTGCHYVYSFEYYTIREWLLPGILFICLLLLFILNVEYVMTS